jgi:energy-coupling factor transporter ATP-binding protein EcfA2
MPEIQVNLEKLQNLMTEGSRNFDPSTIRRKDIVLLIGATGAGKSTTINYMIGHQMVETQTASGRCVVDVDGGNSSPKIGHRVGHNASETLYPAPYEGRGDGSIYCDMPGHDDIGGIERRLVISTFVCRALKLARSVKVMLIIDYNTFSPLGRGGQFLKLCELLKNIFKDIQEIQRSMMVIVTGGPTVVYRRTEEGIGKTNVQSFLHDYLSNLAGCLQSELREGPNNVDHSKIDEMEKEYQIVTSILSCCANNKLINIDVLDNGDCRGRIIRCLHSLQPVATTAFDFGQFDEKRNMFFSKMHTIAKRGLRRFSERRQYNDRIRGINDSINQKNNVIAESNRTIVNLGQRKDQRMTREEQIGALTLEKQRYIEENMRRTTELSQRRETIQNLTGQIRNIERDGELEVRHWVTTAPNPNPNFINLLRGNVPQNWFGDGIVHILGSILEYTGVTVRNVHTFEYPYRQDRPIASIEKRRIDGNPVAAGDLRHGEEFVDKGTNLQEGQFIMTYRAPFGENPGMVVTAFVKRKDLESVRLNKERIVNELTELNSRVNILEHAIYDNDVQIRNLEDRIQRLNVPDMTVNQLNQEIRNLEAQNQRITTEELPGLRNDLQHLKDEKLIKSTSKLDKLKNDIRLFNYVEKILNSLSLEALENDDERGFFSAFLNEYTTFRKETLFVVHYRSEGTCAIHLAGSFNNWLNNNSGRISSDRCLEWKMGKLNNENCWVLTAPLSEGAHSFKYVINEGATWEADPKYLRDSDGNSVMNVGFVGTMLAIRSLLNQAIIRPGEGNKVELKFINLERAQEFQHQLRQIGIENDFVGGNNNNENGYIFALTATQYNTTCQDDDAYSNLVEAMRSESHSFSI